MDDEPNNRSMQTEHAGKQVSCFETTHWSAVLMAAGQASSDADRAFAELCHAYWMPLYAYVRHRVDDAHRAEDLTQTFFAKLLEKGYLRSVDPSKGRFRAFLLTAMKRMMANEWDKQTALKRGGGSNPLSLDFDSANRQFEKLECQTLSAEQVFLQNWVRTLLDRVFERLQQEFEVAGKSHDFSHLQSFITADDHPTRISDVAKRLGMKPGAARVAIHRLRRRYRQVLREQVSETVNTPDEIDDEMRSLFAAFD